MKAILIDKFIKSLDELKISEVPIPVPKEGEVLVKIKASGVNFVDLLYARGKHQNNRTLITPPFILGLEFSGTVVSSPSTTSSPSALDPFPPGTPVFGTHQGTYAEYISVPSSSLHHLPSVADKKWGFVERAGLAGSLPVSYGALITTGALKPNETILIHGASGGLGLAAIQIANSLGCTTIACVSSPLKASICTSYSATHTINTSLHPSFHKQVLELTAGKGVDIVFDTVGMVSESLRCLRPKGRVLVVGFAGTKDPRSIEKIPMNRVLLHQAKIIGYRCGESARLDPMEAGAVWEGVEEMIRRGDVRAMVYNEVYAGLESVRKALGDLEGRKVWGKAVVRVGDYEGIEVKEGEGGEEERGEEERSKAKL